MRDYSYECESRVKWIKKMLDESGAKGIILGNSGGKDCTLVGALCKKATDNVLSVIMPCGSRQNYGSDKDHALIMAQAFGIKTVVVDLTETKNLLVSQLKTSMPITESAGNNINPRLRMTTLYALGQSLSYLVAGTGNKSEGYMGYFTKWGDGGYDFNPISDLTVTEVYEFLEYLNAPVEIIKKAPSAGLFDGQTDEGEMGVSYNVIDKYINTGEGNEKDVSIIKKAHLLSAHKRKMPATYEADKTKP